MKKLFHFLGVTWADILIALGAVLALLLFVPIFTYIYFAKDLVSPDKILNAKNTGVTLLDDKEKPFFTFYQAKYQNYIPLSQVPKVTQVAVLSSEDKGFYSHGGFSPSAMIRAFLSDITHRSLIQGGSTITQQLIKNSLLSNNKNFLRKYQEIVLAQELERRYSKDQILEMYLNSAYFGQGAFGVEEAAQTYFGKGAKDLTLSESALLAGLLPAPSRFSPTEGDKNLALSHQKIVLGKMAAQGYITNDQRIQAASENLSFAKNPADINQLAPHFALMVRDELIQKYGEETIARSGYVVHTTLNSDWQLYAEKTVKEQVANLAKDNVSNGAVVVIDPKTGEVKTLVGSVDWYNSSFGKVNLTLAPRQPGSSFKPILYSDALEQRVITPATILMDTPTTFNQCQNTPTPSAPGCIYTPHDYDNKFWGPVTVRRALDNSRNVPAVEVMQKVGVASAIDQAHKLGITTLSDPSNYGLALALGAGEVRLVDLTNAYATFANNGVKYEPTLITSIDDKYGNEVYHYEQHGEEVLDPGVAFLISSILSDNQTRAEEFGTALNISRAAAVKTGTTENYVDALTLGYTPDLTIGVWVGNNDNTPMDQIAGSLGAAPIWRSLMEHYLQGTPVDAFKPPSDVIASSGCRITLVKDGDKTKTASSSAQEFFLTGTQSSGCSGPSASPGSKVVQLFTNQLNQDQFSFPSPTGTIECTGPDGKHLTVTQEECDAFNRAWGH